ncbi:hypothetical protein [Candidatus Hamiltonella defensa]|uniref:hypothetical protein n=1 Tax=Candidatus Williamhamiltonella defendens TaxID=138072 RepID=UPI0015844642|nr:hypothetical protein [Candidatus Hamiltonella defensa]
MKNPDILNPGRKLYQQYKSKNVFTKDRRKELEKITDYIESAPEALTINPAKPTDNEVNEQTPEKLSKTLKKKKVYVNFLEKIQAAAEAGALDQTEFISIDEIDETSQLSKVYVLAHGIAGDQNIYAKDATQKKSAAEVVSEIKALIKTDQTVDIRLTSCQSADDRTITSFEKTELDEARKNSCGNISLAKHVSNECKTQKVNAKVHGYHGNGVYEYSRFYHKTRKPVGDNKLRIRASKARAEFIPN